MRFHTCYGINMGPRVHDMALKDIVDIILNIRAGAYSFEAANPAPRARVARVEGREAAGRQDPDPRRHHAVQHAGRASRAGRRAHRAVRRRGRTRARHRRQRLRLRDLRGLDGDPSEHRVGQACGPRRGRASRVPPSLGACAEAQSRARLDEDLRVAIGAARSSNARATPSRPTRPVSRGRRRSRPRRCAAGWPRTRPACSRGRTARSAPW